MMNQYRILTDSCVDLPSEVANAIHIIVIPMKVMIDGNIYANYLDGREIGFKAFYDVLRQGIMPSTSQLNPEEIIAVMEPLLSDGIDVLFLSFSSALSGTHQSAVMAQTQLQHKYPERKIVVMDSLCASMGQGLLVWQAAQRQMAGMPMDELVNWVENNKLKVSHLFTIDDLDYLRKGGRLSSEKAFLGKLLGVKPILHVSLEGKLVQTGMARGRRNAIRKLLDRMEETIDTTQDPVVFLSHGDCEEDVAYVTDLVQERYPRVKIMSSFVGPVIGSHSGLHTLAIFYMGSDRYSK